MSKGNSPGVFRRPFRVQTYQKPVVVFSKAPAATSSLFRVSNLSGLQSGGPFFLNPLG